jgi:hypothetical protein
MKFSPKLIAIIVLGMIALPACGSSEAETFVTQTASARAATVDAVNTELAIRTEQAEIQPSATLAPTSTQTPEPGPSATASPTPLPPRVRVSENTNCRSGPDSSFQFLGVLSVDEEAVVLAKSDLPDYWLITNPDTEGGENCWLWGAFATIEGDTSNLPIITPEPTPTPYVGFDIWFHGFEPCGGSQTAIFAIRNAGAVRIWSGWVAVYAMDPLDDLYGPAKERHPFADRPLPACPPGHGNELYPGEIRYIHTPLSNVPHDRDAYAEVTLCTADHGGGDCVTKIGYFYIP